ncbi:hypothetical protein Ddye_019000 [Dipteronia dyeriana]|uniref:Uncharacterized protein n=1 Tax=Dipteronia dyeriana TaxID=168575 RepID=A0AAD9TX02_9ROSI|nr:hypothetical protein Ddye_019000 [Dipteronia dyeriana]
MVSFSHSRTSTHPYNQSSPPPPPPHSSFNSTTPISLYFSSTLTNFSKGDSNADILRARNFTFNFDPDDDDQDEDEEEEGEEEDDGFFSGNVKKKKNRDWWSKKYGTRKKKYTDWFEEVIEWINDSINEYAHGTPSLKPWFGLLLHLIIRDNNGLIIYLQFDAINGALFANSEVQMDLTWPFESLCYTHFLATDPSLEFMFYLDK